MVNSEAVLKRWKKYFEKLMNEENNRDPRTEEAEMFNEEVNCVSRKKVKNALRRMKTGKAVGPDELPIKVWKCMGEIGIKFVTRLFNRINAYSFFFYIKTSRFHVLGISRNLPSYWHEKTALVPPSNGRYILVESLSLFITYFTNIRAKEIQVGMQRVHFKNIQAPNCSFAFNMRSTISAQ